MGEIPRGLGTDQQLGQLPWFLAILICFKIILESCLALKPCGPKALLFPFVEVALPANLVTDIVSWKATSIYMQRIFTKLTSATQKPHIQFPMQSYWVLRCAPLCFESRKEMDSEKFIAF